jgi:hypothetical protein
LNGKRSNRYERYNQFRRITVGGHMTAPAANEVVCPKCGGRMWDNRGKKTNPKAPDFKCKNKSCDGVIWPQKKQTDAVAGSIPPAASAPKKSIAQMYIESTDFVLATIVPKYEAKEIGMTPEAIASCVATIFIARTKDGNA